MLIYLILLMLLNCAFANPLNTNQEVVFIPPEEHTPAQTYYYQQPVTHYYHHEEPQHQQHLPNYQYHVQDVYGQYSYGYKTADGMEKKEIRQADGTVVGSYSYISPEGKRVVVNYTAGKDGYRASSDIIPKPVEPTPEVVEATRKHMAALAAAQTAAGYNPNDYGYVAPEYYNSVPYEYSYPVQYAFGYANNYKKPERYSYWNNYP